MLSPRQAFSLLPLTRRTHFSLLARLIGRIPPRHPRTILVRLRLKFDPNSIPALRHVHWNSTRPRMKDESRS